MDIDERCRPSARLTDHMRGRITNVTSVLLQRRRVAFKFPLDDTDTILLTLIQSLMPDESVAAIETLHKDGATRHLLSTTRRTKLFVGDLSFRISLDNSAAIFDAYLSGTAHRTIEPSHPYYNEIYKWVKATTDLDKKCDRVTSAIYQVINSANTSGQIKRMWPELLGYLPQDVQSKLNAATRASRIPSSWLNSKDEYDLVEATGTLALMAMLPETGTPKVTL